MHSNEAVDIENKNIRHFQNARIRIYYARSSLLENNNKQIHQKCDPIFRLEQFVEHPLHIARVMLLEKVKIWRVRSSIYLLV